MGMQNILATWIYLDDKASASYFPSAKGISSDFSTQSIYWKCLIVSMFTARFYNADLRLVVFSNCKSFPCINGVDIAAVLTKLDVECHFVEFSYMTPNGYYGNWRNQFYEFSIFEYISKNNSFGKSDNFCLIDSDCVISASLDSMFCDIAKNDLLAYRLNYGPDHIINGLSRKQMKLVYEDITGDILSDFPVYYGGEFFAARVEIVDNVSETFKDLWGKLLELHKNEKLRLNEEAHVLSYLFFNLKFENDFANRYVKRMWTDPTTLRNIVSSDRNLLIWHLPAEKKTGFNELFGILMMQNFEVNRFDKQTFREILGKATTVISVSYTRRFYWLFKGIAKKLLRK